jgi:hypothetical protein
VLAHGFVVLAREQLLGTLQWPAQAAMACEIHTSSLSPFTDKTLFVLRSCFVMYFDQIGAS